MNDNARIVGSDQIRRLMLRIFVVASVALFAKVLFEILYQYRWYFPPDFENATFLIGRRPSFHGLYQAAFYTHIVAGPIALLAGLYLFVSGILGHHLTIHRWVGRILMLLVLVAIVPSGLVMALRAHSGPIAAAAFTVLAILTAVTVVAALNCARRRDFTSHRVWALRCFILLSSTLVLRVMNGAASTFQLDAEWFYQLSAWLSWLVPLCAFEIVQRGTSFARAFRARIKSSPPVQRRTRVNATDR